MRIKVLINLLFLLHIFIYNLYGDYDNQIWNSVYYIGLCLYISINIFADLSQCFVRFHKIALISVMVYFLFFMITEIATILKPELYNDLIINPNLIMSGALVIFMLFITLTYLIFIRNDKKSIYRRHD